MLEYADGEKAYILAPNGLNVGEKIIAASGSVEEFTPGISVKLRFIPPATDIHSIEMEPGQGARIARSAGNSAQLLGIEGDLAIIKMPSGEQRYLNANCRATIGRVGNAEHQNRSLGKAGRNRWLGRRPRVRGMVMNPVDHPNGGGQGKSRAAAVVSTSALRGDSSRKASRPASNPSPRTFISLFVATGVKLRRANRQWHVQSKKAITWNRL